MTQTVDLWDLLAKGARELARLLVPLVCVGCATPDHVLCPRCKVHFLTVPVQAQEQVPRLAGTGVPLWTLGSYAQPINLLIMGWKDGRRVDLTPYLQQIMMDGAGLIAQNLLSLAGNSDAQSPPVNIVVVPLPSSAASRRRRGFIPAHELAKAVVTGLRRELGTGARVTFGPGLTVRAAKADQVGLDTRNRAKNLAGTLKSSKLLDAQCYAANVILLVDDLVTTGATMREATRVLPRHSGTLVAAMSLCVTPARAKQP